MPYLLIKTTFVSVILRLLTCFAQRERRPILTSKVRSLAGPTVG